MHKGRRSLAPAKPNTALDPCRPTSEMIVDGMVRVRDYTAFFINGDQYTGSWKDGKKHGKGTYKWKKSGLIFEGDWADDRRDGFGTMSVLMKNGKYRKQYIGAWSGGKKHGYGTHFYSDTVKYEGEWKCGKRDGWGRMVYRNCSIYEGQWADDKPNGIGMTLYSNGCRHEGMYVNGKKEGIGKFYHTDKGQIFDGLWINDLPKCGAMTDHDRENVPDATPFPLPKLTLLDADKVLQEAIKSYLPDDNENNEIDYEVESK